MSATSTVLIGLKSLLRSRGITYRELARQIGVSEPTIKRDLSKGNFSLKRLDQICVTLGITLAELVQSPAGAGLVTQLTESQELALSGNPKILLVTYLLVNDWKFRDVVDAFRMDENELIEILLRLDQLKIIEFRPPHRVRKLTSRNFAGARTVRSTDSS